MAWKRFVLAVLMTVALSGYGTCGEYLGNLSADPYDPDSTSNPYGAENVMGSGLHFTFFAERYPGQDSHGPFLLECRAEPPAPAGLRGPEM